jgi:hypothetical protein
MIEHMKNFIFPKLRSRKKTHLSFSKNSFRARRVRSAQITCSSDQNLPKSWIELALLFSIYYKIITNFGFLGLEFARKNGIRKNGIRKGALRLEICQFESPVNQAVPISAKTFQILQNRQNTSLTEIGLFLFKFWSGAERLKIYVFLKRSSASR